MKSILVFFGGKSAEHEISVITGVLTLNSIDKNLYNPIPVFVDRKGSWLTGENLNDVAFYKKQDFKNLKSVCLLPNSNCLYEVKKSKLIKITTIECAINCMHGLNGEDGSLAGLLKMANIPFASPDIYSSSLSIDKDFTKVVLSGLSVEKLPYVRLFKKPFFAKTVGAIKMIEKKLSYPVIVKPCKLGSSIGINIAKDGKSLIKFLVEAFKYDDKVIVEHALTDFIEINCAGYKKDDKIIVSECEQPITRNEILSFNDKYLGSKTGATRKMPAEIPKEIRDKIRQTTEKIYRKCDFIGVIRIDYIVKDGKIFVNEINTVPGSLAYYLFTDSIKGFSDILTDLIEEGIKKFISENNRDYNFNSNILSTINRSGSKIKTIDKNRL